MGRTRKRFNQKARQSQNVETCRDEKDRTLVNIQVQDEKYDSSNPLVIIGKKKKLPKTPQKELPVIKPLSRKEKKKLAKRLAKKEKKLSRTELLEKLSKVQAKPKELDYLTSTASMQTHGIKKLIHENTVTEKKRKISNIKGSKKKNVLSPEKKMKLDHSVTFEKSSSESDEEFGEESNSDESNSFIDENFNNEDKHIADNNSGDSNSLQEASEAKSSIDVTKSVQNVIPDKADNIERENTNTDEKQDTEKASQDEGKEVDLSSAVRCDRVPAVFVPLHRLPEIQAARENLPIFLEEQSIMEAIRENPVVVIHGETGSGKTTQVPQFLYEGGYTQNNKMIGITEPRRVAAMTMASRVGVEMNLSDVVAYHVRYEHNVKEDTRIKFMTDGVLLKEIRRDFFLSRYSVIIIDEAHERSVFSDVLIGLLSRIVPIREKRGDPLKLIIMSATIRVEDFVENPKLFKEPPFLIRLESRQYKVQVHFNIQTPSDYVEAAYHKVCKIHNQLPAGSILVFVTGEKEVTALCKLLRNTYPFKDNSSYTSENLKCKNQDQESSISFNKKKKKIRNKDTSFSSLPEKINLDDYSAEPLDTENLEHQLSDEDDASYMDSVNVKSPTTFMSPLYTLPLYSILPYAEQEKVFQPPPAGSRLCVVSTNVAETSITIPGLKYVVDSGKVKTKVYDKLVGGISQFCITWTSKASANQRAGRAGRTEGGHCYRLYSSSVFEHEFQDFAPPEIQRIPVDDVLLQLKASGITRVVDFPFPTPPDSEALKVAEQRLIHLGALENLNKGERFKDIKKWEYSAKATPLGEAMARFPLSPRYAKMLILSYKHKCVPYIIALVSAMTVPEIFMRSTSGDDENKNEERTGIRKINPGTGKSLELGDATVLLRAVALFEKSKNKIKFCIKNGIRHKAMVEVHKMALQLIREMNRAFKDLSLPFELTFDPPNEEQIEILQKILTTGFTDHVARIYPKEEMKLNKEIKNAYKCLDLEDPVFIHPSSVLFSELPTFIIYREIVYTSKYYMKGIIEIDPSWLAGFAPTLCKFSEPLEEPAPSYDSGKDRILCTVNVTFGPYQWEIPDVTMEMPEGVLKYKWFAFFLLDGQIYGFFKQFKKYLLSSPSTLRKDWAKGIPRIRYLLQALITKQVDTRESLEKVWTKEPQFLLREYFEWLPNAKHLEIECGWPPKL